MPPTEPTAQATILYLSRLLSAVAMRSPKKEIRIAQHLLDEISGAEGKRALFEDYDEKTDEVVLTFRQKSVATYLVEGVSVSTTQPIPATPPSTQNHTRMPLTDDQITNLEKKIAREKAYRAIKREPPQSFSL